MEAFPRIALLGTFAAAGIGLAICIATSVAVVPSAHDNEIVPNIGAYAAGVDIDPAASSLNTPSVFETAQPEVALVAPRFAADVAKLPVTTTTDDAALKIDPVDKSSDQWITELIDVIKLQAEQQKTAAAPSAPSSSLTVSNPVETFDAAPVPADMPVMANSVPSRAEQLSNTSESLPPPPQPPTDAEAEELPAAAARAPSVVRNADDHRLRITVQNSEIRDVLELLSQQGDLNILASKNVTGSVSASLVGVDVESALDAILKSTGFLARREGKFIYVGSPEDFHAMDQSLDLLTTRVYRPNYIRGADVQALVTPMLTPGVGKITISTQSQVDIPGNQIQTGGDMMSGTDVVIVKDYEQVLLQIDELLCEVDQRPRQVLIDAMIISVKLSDENKFGVNWQMLKHKANVKLGLGTPPTDINNVTFGGGGLTFGYVDSSITNLVTALESIGETNVVAAPRLLCLNKQRAEIQIGEQLGYVSTTVTETSSTQSVQFLDTGTLLRLRPFIAGDGTIRMEVHPELSKGSVTTSQGITLPNKEVTQVTSNVMCQNGSTVVIGGLIREDIQTNLTQIPGLGNIPVLGTLFRQKNDKLDRYEILVLITPRLVDDPAMSEEGARLGNEFLRRQDVAFDKMSPISRRHHGKQYLRKAKAAWAACDAKVALKYANLAVDFDPVSRDAIRLRDEVAAVAAPHESVDQYLKQGTGIGHHPHKDYSKKGRPWKDPAPFGTTEMEIVSDGGATVGPGAPGRSIRIDPPPPSSHPALSSAKREPQIKRK